MNAKKENLETKAKKTVLKIGDTVKNIEYVLRDLSMKLYYMIKNKKHYSLTNGFDHKNDYLGCNGNH